MGVYFNMYGYFAYMHICVPHAHSACGEQKKMSNLNSRYRELLNWTQVLWKQAVLVTLSQLSNPGSRIFILVLLVEHADCSEK